MSARFFSFSVKHSYCAAPAFSCLGLCLLHGEELVARVCVWCAHHCHIWPSAAPLEQKQNPNPISLSILTPDVCTATAQDASCRVSWDCPLFSSAPDRGVRVTAQKLVGGD